jgi:tetratricopeptide (TPR) repeat protein
VAPPPLAFRAADLTALDALADGIEGQVLVVTGAPGVGKTALAETFARARAANARTVALGAIAGVPELEDALASLSIGELGERVLPDVLVADDVRTREIGAVFAALAERNPSTLVVATTGDRTLVPGAQIHELRPLPVDEASSLLVALARRTDPAWSPTPADGPNLQAIAELTSGLPLGLALAAARLPILGARALRFRLEKSFDVLARSAGGGKSALELSIATAVDALEPGVRAVLAKVAFFTYPFGAAAAEAVASGGHDVLDALTTLRAASLLESAPDGDEVRFFVPRAIARVTVEPTPAAREAFDERHAEYYAALAERSTRDELWRERDQIFEVARRVLGVKPLTARRAEPALRALLALGPRVFDEASTDALDALSAATLRATQGSGARPGLVAGLQWLRGALARRRGDERASNDLVAALSVARTIGDRFLDARCTVELGHLLAARGDLAEAEAHFTRAAPELVGEERALALAAASDAARERGDFFEATLHVVRAEEIAPEASGVQRARMALLLDEGATDARAKVHGVHLGHALHEEGELEGAHAAYRAAGARGFDGIVLLEEGKNAEAWVLLGDAVERARRHDPPHAALFAAWLAHLAGRLDRADEAARRAAEARALAASVRRSWVDATLATILGGPGPEARSVHVRIARRIVEAAPTERSPAPPPDALVVGEAGAWFRAPGGAAATPLRTRKNLARIVEAFAREPARSFTASELFAIGWPGERALGPASAHRVRVAVATLRKMGLDAVIARRGDGWGIAEGVKVLI